MSRSNKRRLPSEVADEEVMDIDTGPIMNMLVILIPFLISMAVFQHFSVHKFFLTPNAESAPSATKGPIQLKTTVVVGQEYMVVMIGQQIVDSLTRNPDKGYERARLEKAMLTARTKSDDTTAAVVSVRDKVAFQHAVEAMDYCRKAGFEAVGLSSAPEEGQ